MTFQEILQVKDDILKNNRFLEEKIKSHIDIYGSKFTEEINSFSERINKVNANNKKFMDLLPDINFKLSKIEQIEKFDVRTEHKLASYEMRITSILEQIEKIKTKYDKIILDNLFVSGYIGGAHSQYANMSEYILSNINDVNLLKIEKDQLKRETKTMKNKNDNVIKQTVNLVEASVKRCNLYTDNKQKDFQLLLDTKMREFTEKIMEIRMNVCKIQMQTEEAVNNLNINFDKLKEENKFFMEDILDKINEIKNGFDEFKNKYDKNLNILIKDNTNVKNETLNIKENIGNLLKIIYYYQTQDNSNQDFNINQRNFDDSIDTQKRLPNLKGSYFSLLNEPKPQLNLYSPKARKNKKKFNIFNSVNFNINNMNNTGQIRRSMKKRNTVAYTTSIFNSQIKNKLKDNIQDYNSKINKPTFLGLLTPILQNIINFKEEEKNNKSNIKGRNDEKLELFSTLKSDGEKLFNKDKSENSDTESKKSSKI